MQGFFVYQNPWVKYVLRIIPIKLQFEIKAVLYKNIIWIGYRCLHFFKIFVLYVVDQFWMNRYKLNPSCASTSNMLFIEFF